MEYSGPDPITPIEWFPTRYSPRVYIHYRSTDVNQRFVDNVRILYIKCYPNYPVIHILK